MQQSETTLDRPDTTMALAVTGIFEDAGGITYRSGTLEGYTGPQGQFQYFEGSDVSFSIGSLELGTAKGRPRLTVLDLVAERSLTNPKLVNRARLLFTLTSSLGFEKVVQVDEEVRIIHPKELNG